MGVRAPAARLFFLWLFPEGLDFGFSRFSGHILVFGFRFHAEDAFAFFEGIPGGGQGGEVFGGEGIVLVDGFRDMISVLEFEAHFLENPALDLARGMVLGLVTHMVGICHGLTGGSRTGVWGGRDIGFERRHDCGSRLPP